MVFTGNVRSSSGNRKPDFAEPQNIPSLASSNQPPVKRKAVGNDVRTIAVLINSLAIKEAFWLKNDV